MKAPTPPQTDARILVVDDEEINVRVLQRILVGAGYRDVCSTTDSGRALSLYRQFSPDLVLLDLHMPVRDGFDVLEELSPHINSETYVPVLMLTGDASPDARRRALLLGARDFVLKPFDAQEILLRIHNLLETRFLYRVLEKQNADLEVRIAARTWQLEKSQIEILDRLAGAGEFRDGETGLHTARVGKLASRLGMALGMDENFVKLVERAAPLHDIGKIGVPDNVLLKAGALSVEEFGLMKVHTTIGASILAGGESDVLVTAERIALRHHERMDGSGYPGGIAGDEIPIEARLVAVADVFDALTHDRPYRAAWPLDVVLRYLEKNAGSHFDSAIVRALLSSRCYVEARKNLTPKRVRQMSLVMA